MKFEILVVDDDESWTRTFCDNLRAMALADWAGPAFDDLHVTHVTNQQEADRLIALSGTPQFHLILLDLNYPKTLDGPLRLDPIQPLQGMVWLPELRHLQPKATIVILTAWAYEKELANAVAAIRDFHANDFVPKTAPFTDIAGRLALAMQNARQRHRLLVLEREWPLAKSRAAMVYAQDVADVFVALRGLADRIAQRIESGDPSSIENAPDDIRAEFRSATREIGELTDLMDRRLNPGGRRRELLNLGELLDDLLLQYEGWLDDAKARSIRRSSAENLSVVTLGCDLKVALHEVLANAVESLAISATPPGERVLLVAATRDKGDAVIQIEDNGEGFSNEALANLFKLGRTTRGAREHVGMGLYVARRAMIAIGGDLKAENRPDGGARVRLFVPNMK